MPDQNDSHLTPPTGSGSAASTASHPSFSVDSFATHRDHRVQITATYDDDTADVQRVDKDGAVELDANLQPQWTPKVPFAELS